MQTRFNIIVKGHVQGVGYRYFCQRKAEQYDIKGYARNLADGSVEIDVEGESSLMKDFLKDLKTGPMNASVRSFLIEEFPFENNYTEFKIY